jgi:CBS domain-containing protein
MTMPLSETIRQIYVPLSEYPHVVETATLREAFAALHAGFASGRRYRHVLVLNAAHQLIGILGMRDILRGLFPDYLRSRELAHHAQAPVPDFPALTLIWAQTFHSQCQEVAKKPVADFMGAIPATVSIDDPITKAAYLLVIHDVSMLPVVETGHLVGVVRMIDVFNQAAKAVLDE